MTPLRPGSPPPELAAEISRSGIALVLVAHVAGAVVSLGALAVVVARFGVGPELDGYFWAWTGPQLLAGSVALIIGHVVVPGLAEARRRGGVKLLYECLCPLFYWALIVLLGIGVVGVAVAWWAWYALRHDLGLVGDLTPWLLGVVALTGVAGVLAAALRVRGRPVGPAAMPLVDAACVIAAVTLWAEDRGIVAVAMGWLMGSAANVVLMAALCFADGFRLRRMLYGPPLARQMLGELHSPAGTGISSQAHLVIERLLATLLGPGYVAALGLAGGVARTLEAVPRGAVAAFVEPPLADIAAGDDRAPVTARLQGALAGLMAWFLPIALCAALVGLRLAELLFPTQPAWCGVIGPAIRVYLATALFVVGEELLLVPSQLTGQLHASSKVLELSAGTRAVLMAALAVGVAGLGERAAAAGIAVGTSIGSICSMGFAAVVVSHLGYKVLGGMAKPLARALVPTAGAVVAAYLMVTIVTRYLEGSPAYAALVVACPVAAGGTMTALLVTALRRRGNR